MQTVDIDCSNKTKEVTFKYVEKAQYFVYKGELYMKIEECNFIKERMNFNINAVNCKTKSTVLFDNYDVVKKVKKVTITYEEE